jgi:hypothetical protein
MSKLERLVLAVLLCGAMLWIAWLEIGEGTASPTSWPWGVLAAVLLASFSWRMGGHNLSR